MCKTKNVAHEIFISEPTVNFCKASPSASVAVRYQRCYTHCSMGEAARTRTPDIELFRDVFNASPIGIAVETLEGQPLFVNPAFCSMLGFSEEELRYKHCVDFSPPEDAERDWALFQQLRAGSINHYQLEKRYFRRDGSLVWGSLSISLLKSSPSPLVLAMVEDITDKKNAEEARFRHAAVIESSDDAIASGTFDGIIVSWNTGAQKIYGYTEAEAVGKPISMLVPPELPDEENKILETLKSGDRIEHFETVRVTKTGKRINVSLTISPIKDSTGRTVGISGIARDITERKLAEEALRASEERLRLAQQAARIGTFDWNIRTGVNTWTPELEAMYGLPPGGFGGTQTVFENLVHPDDRAGVIKLVDAAMKSGQPTKGEWRVVWGDRSVHWIAGRWQVFRDASGEPSKMIGVNIDITERKRAEEALRESEEWLHLAVQAGRMYAFEWDATTDVIVRSGECADILNWIDDPTRDTGREFAARVHPDDREAYTAPEMVLTPGNPTYKTSYRVLRPDGSAIWLEANGHVFFDDQGRLQRIIGMVADVTGRKLAEEALFRLSRRLIEAQELERARIARELHDDLSQRMALLQISLEQVAQDTAGLSSKIRQQLHNITKVSAEISSSLHDLSHQLHPYKLDTLGLVAALGGFCNEFSRQHNLQVQFVHHHVPGQIPNEVTLCLFRIAQEALRNVVKHSGGTEAEVELSGHGDRIDLCISDSGVGFSPEHVKAETGLGLISIRERLRLVGGHLSVESEPSHGTRIRARVPLFTIKSEVTGDGKAHKAGA